MINTVGLPKQEVTWINFAALFIFMMIQSPLPERYQIKLVVNLYYSGLRPGTLFSRFLFLLHYHTQKWLGCFWLDVGLVIASGYTLN